MENKKDDSHGEWPDSVGFREDDPKPGMVYIIMSITGVKVLSSCTGKTRPQNAEILNPEDTFKPSGIHFKLKVTNTDGKPVIYEYKKSLPKPIDPKASTVKFEKNGQVKLRVKKGDVDISWAPFAQYLTCQEEPTE